jgi:hypothetical protein
MYYITSYTRRNGLLTYTSFQIETLDDIKVKAMIMDIINGDKSDYMVVTNIRNGNKVFVDKRNVVEWAFEYIVKNI